MEVDETVTLLLVDSFEVVEEELRTEVDEEGFTDELEVTSVEDFEELTDVVDTLLEETVLELTIVEDLDVPETVVDPTTVEIVELLEIFEEVDDTRLLLLEADDDSKYSSRRFPAPQYS